MSVNKVILLGNLGQDPEIKIFESGNKVASFTLATTQKGFTTKSGNVIQDRTEWHNVKVVGGLSDIVEKYLHKGSKIYLEGEIRYREYEKDGAKKYITEIFARSFEMCDKPQTTPNNGVSPTSQPNIQQQPQTTPQQPFNGFNGDDLPF